MSDDEEAVMSPQQQVRVDGDKIRAAREGLGKTATDFAIEVGVTRVTLWKWETGRAQPTVDALFSIARATGKQVEDFIADGGKGEPA